MTLDERRKEALWRLYAHRTEREENVFKRTFHRCLLKQRDGVISNLIRGRDAEDALFDYKEAVKDFKNGFQPVIQHTVIAGARQAVDLVGILKQFGPEMLNQQALRWIETDSLKLAKGVNKTTRPVLRRSLAEGFKEGESIPKLTNRVKEVYSQRYSRHAGTLARTETIRASNYGALQGYNEAGVERVEFYVALDERTCEECEGLNGKYFSVDEAQGLIPVHPNCRCTYLPVIPKEIQDRPPEKPEGPSGEDWAKKVNADEKDAIQSWQRGGYSKIRDAQMRGDISPQVKKYIKNINRALDKDGSYRGEVFRGLNNLDKKTFDSIINSGKFKFNTFSSATTDPNVAAKFVMSSKDKQSIFFKIQNKTGVDLSAVSHSKFAYEKEVLLRTGSNYKTVSRSEKIITYINPEGKKFRQKVTEMVLAEI